jgi:hypothetical protein
MILEV